MIWKSVVGFEGLYEVSSCGVVRSVPRIINYADGRKYTYPSKVLSHNINKTNSAHLVHLYKNSKRTAKTVHRLVMEAHCPNTDYSKAEINHKDGNRNNNTVDNLEWCSRLENMQHGFSTGLINNTGSNHGNSIYNEAQIAHVKRLLNSGLSASHVAILSGVKKGTVEQVRQGKQWKHVI